MKYVKDKNSYNRKQSLKEFFISLKLHQKILLVFSSVMGLINFIFAVIRIEKDFSLQIKCSPLNVDLIIYLIRNAFHLYPYVLVVFVVNILQIIFIHFRKFSYTASISNIIVSFFNDFLKIAIVFSIIGTTG